MKRTGEQIGASKRANDVVHSIPDIMLAQIQAAVGLTSSPDSWSGHATSSSSPPKEEHQVFASSFFLRTSQSPPAGPSAAAAAEGPAAEGPDAAEDLRKCAPCLSSHKSVHFLI